MIDDKFIFSFDFDGTLGQSKELQNFCKQFITLGHTVKIVTRRYEKGYDEHQEVLMLAKELGIISENIHFTNRDWKFGHIKKIGIEYHIDDDYQDYYYILTHTTCIPIMFDEKSEWKDILEKMLSGVLPVKKK